MERYLLESTPGSYCGVNPIWNTGPTRKYACGGAVTPQRKYPCGDPRLSPTAISKRFNSDERVEYLWFDHEHGYGNKYCKTRNTSYFYANGDDPHFGVDLEALERGGWASDMRRRIKDTHLYFARDLYELHETASAFHSVYKGIVRAIERVRRGDLGGAFGAVTGLRKKAYQRNKNKRRQLDFDDISSAVIVTDYGLAPTLSFLTEAALRLDSRLQLSLVKRFKAFSETEEKLDHDTWYGNHVSGVVKASERCVAYVEFKNPDQKFQSGNFAEFLWEGIPFSFILDQIIPVGDWLATLDALHDVKSLIGTVTRKEHLSWHTTKNGYFNSSRGRDVRVSRHARYGYNSFARSIVNRDQIPIPDFPGYEPSDNIRQVIDDVALLRVLRARGRP
jgi:hypothetical protein